MDARRSTALGEVVVTGTHIRGVAPVGAQIIGMDRNDIDKTGLATVQDVVRTLPQNFGGIGNPMRVSRWWWAGNAGFSGRRMRGEARWGGGREGAQAASGGVGWEDRWRGRVGQSPGVRGSKRDPATWRGGMQQVMRSAFDRIRIRDRVPGRSDPPRGFDRSTIRTRH